MRKINKLVAIAILATMATFSAPQTFAGIIMTDRTTPADTSRDSTGIIMTDLTGIIMTDFAQALTGILMSD